MLPGFLILRVLTVQSAQPEIAVEAGKGPGYDGRRLADVPMIIIEPKNRIQPRIARIRENQ